MRIAALYDVHGNLPALEAVLAEIESLEVDLVVFGGDIAPGPMPRETLDRVLALRERARLIRGNGERELAAPSDGDDPWTVSARWGAQQLPNEQVASMASLPERVTLGVDGLGGVLFCHGSPRSDDEIITLVSSHERLTAILSGVQERTVVCGHTHSQFDRMVGETRVVNAGSVGMPYEDAPGAYWALLGSDVELRRTVYDFEAAAARIRATGWPLAEEFAAENVLNVPPAREAAAFFEKMAAERAAGTNPRDEGR